MRSCNLVYWLFLLHIAIANCSLISPNLRPLIFPHALSLRSYPHYASRSPFVKSIGVRRIPTDEYSLTLPQEENSKRLSFLRKVYGLLSTQIATTLLSTLYIRNNVALQKLLFTNFQAISTASFLGSFAILNAFAWSPQLRYRPPFNYLLLAVYTAFQSTFIGTIASAFAPQIALTAALHTFTAFTALTIFAFTQRTYADLSAKRGLLITLLTSVSCGSLLNMIFGTPLLHSLFSGISAVLMSLFIIADTQAIVSGSHSRGYGTKDHILASMSLYQHATSLFLRILQYVENASQKERERRYRY